MTVRISDHLPVYAFIGGKREVEGAGGVRGKRRLVNERRIERFAEELDGFHFDVERALGVEGNVARFRNGFRDLYDAAFPWVESKKKRKDIEKPWLDDDDFKELVREKGDLYSRKVRGTLDLRGLARLAEVTKEVNRMRQRLKRAYFSQRMEEIQGDLRATWEVLNELLRGRSRQDGGGTCRDFEKGGVGITDRVEIAEGFCDSTIWSGLSWQQDLRESKRGRLGSTLGTGWRGPWCGDPPHPQKWRSYAKAYSPIREWGGMESPHG